MKKEEIAKRKGTNPPRKVGTSKKEVNRVKEQEPQPEVLEAELYSDKPRETSALTNSVF